MACSRPLHVFAVIGSCLCASAAAGQWISFTDDTANRLTLSSVALNDNQEKDIVVGDFDQDGWDDIVVVRKEPFSNAGPRTDVLLMNESGVLIDRTATLAAEFISIPSDSRDVFAADFTGDGWLDLIFANTFDQQPSFYRNLGNNGGGVWQGFVNESAARLPVLAPLNQPDGPQFCALTAADVDNDNDIDVYFSNYRGQITSDVMLINDGTGNFTDETAARFGTYANVAFGTSSEFHDFDNDGDQDLIKTSTLYNVPPFNAIGTFILYNNGSGVFNTVPFTKIDGDQPYMFTVGFLDGDNMLDIYEVDDFEDRTVFINSTPPDGPVAMSSTLLTSPRTERFGGNVKLADLDGDGDLDVGVAPIDVDIQNCGTGVEFALLRNPGDGLFEDPWSAANTQNFHVEAHDFAFIDIDGDGCLDIFMGLCTGWQVLMRDNCVPPNPPAVIISLPNGVPSVLEPGVATQFDVQLLDGDQAVVGGTLHYSFTGGSFLTVALQPQGGGGADLYTATIPPAECLQEPRFFITADGDGGGTESSPPDAPAGFYFAIAGQLVSVRNDEMEGPNDDGWAVNTGGTDDATTGVWERGNPNATDAQPENDSSPVGTLCWYTGQSAAGAGNGVNDVDGGTTTLYSPVFDLTTAAAATISYWRWYSNDEGPSPDADVFVVEINNGISGWVEVETVGPTSPGEAWLQNEFDPATIVALTATMQVRFIASDLGAGSIVEAGIDDFDVSIIECNSPICAADIVGGNNAVNVFDLLEVLANWGTAGTGADIAQPANVVDVFDLLGLLASWGNCP